jgi:hypothetical protein
MAGTKCDTCGANQGTIPAMTERGSMTDHEREAAIREFMDVFGYNRDEAEEAVRIFTGESPGDLDLGRHDGPHSGPRGRRLQG